MDGQSEYYKYTLNPDLRKSAEKKADYFVKNELQFQLGHLPTEQSHPYTRVFSQTVQKKPEEGVNLLLKVDGDLPPVARRILLSDQYNQLTEAFSKAAANNNKVCFSGCGSTGRLAIMLEEMWRQYWEDQSGVSPGTAAGDLKTTDSNLIKANLACSIMTGGDRALIRAAENFEDYAVFGRRQVSDLNLSNGDLLIAITEGGETSSVLGTAEEALERGCTVFLVYSNPDRILCSTIDRSRAMIEHPDVTAIDLYSGAMSLTGSTRMQATTLEMMIVGSAMEEAFLKESVPDFSLSDRLKQADQFAELINILGNPENLAVLADLAVKESDIYTAGGRVTYFASRFLLDIFCDTSERSPTFMLPPFRPADDKKAPVSWAYAKDPGRPGNKAWFNMLRRSPRCIEWNEADYRFMNAPSTIINNPPSLGKEEIARYIIGREPDVSRTENPPFWFLQIQMGDIPLDVILNEDILSIGKGQKETQDNCNKGKYHLCVDLQDSPILLWHHLAIKLVLNTISTASMGIMGRIRGNWMVQLNPTNKKLIDRGSRIISQLGGISYKDACMELYLSILARTILEKEGGETTTSPVVDALDRIKIKKTGDPSKESSGFIT